MNIQSETFRRPATQARKQQRGTVTLNEARICANVTTGGGVATTCSGNSTEFLHRAIMANGLQATVCLKCGRELAVSPHLLGLEAAEKAHKCGGQKPPTAVGVDDSNLYTTFVPAA